MANAAPFDLFHPTFGRVALLLDESRQKPGVAAATFCLIGDTTFGCAFALALAIENATERQLSFIFYR